MRHRPTFLIWPVALGLAGAGLIGQDRPLETDAPVFTRLVVKLVPSTRESGQPPSAIVGELKQRLPAGGGWTQTEIPGSAGVFELRPAATEAGGAPMSPSEAWGAAHRLRTDTRVEYAEPSFAVNGAPGETVELEDCLPAPVPESGGDATPLPGAVADPEWSLGPKGANVLDAWTLFPTGQVPGQGIWIGHPDTGYRPHPEIFAGNDHPVRAELGWDFVENDNDASDAFGTGTLRNPGHGTRTSSVIVSARGRQLSGDSKRGVSGVAPGARLIPLRVANGVVVFDMTNLASAIRAAAGDDRNLVKQKVDVISISMGGPPSRALKDAVDFAERHGVLVLAAAGNQVKKVVWPARYDNVIAVAASNVNSVPWAGSSHGQAVAITAPGESVWVASPKPSTPQPLDCLQMGSGTSYAVATTAGIAALWMSRHQVEPRFRALRRAGRQTEAFRQVVRASFRTVDGWNTADYGPGILDARKVLDAPLPLIPERAPSAQDRCSRDLEATEALFDVAANPRARIQRLFGGNACRRARVADEIPFLYVTDVRVRDALDHISSKTEPSVAAWSEARQALRRSGSPQLQAAIPRR